MLLPLFPLAHLLFTRGSLVKNMGRDAAFSGRTEIWYILPRFGGTPGSEPATKLFYRSQDWYN